MIFKRLSNNGLPVIEATGPGKDTIQGTANMSAQIFAMAIKGERDKKVKEQIRQDAMEVSRALLRAAESINIAISS